MAAARVVGGVDPYFQRQHEVTIAPLKCSQPMHLHPCFPTIREETNAWLLSVIKPSTADAARFAVQAQFPFLACSAFANAPDQRRLAAVAKFMAWTFFMDDMLDVHDLGIHLFGSLEGKLNNARQQKPARLHVDQLLAATSDPKIRHSLSKAMDSKGMQWWREMKALGMSPAMQRRFLGALVAGLEGQKLQTQWREANQVPELKTFVETRRKAGGVAVLLTLNEWCAQVEIGERMEEDELLGSLNMAANDHVCWVNDLMSLKWEYANGDLNNMPTVVCNRLRRQASYADHHARRRRHFFQQSVDIVHRLVRQRDHDFACLLRRAHTTPSLMAIPGLPLYLQSLGNWMSGHLSWCYATSRYHGLDLSLPLPLHQPLTITLSPPPLIPPPTLSPPPLNAALTSTPTK